MPCLDEDKIFTVLWSNTKRFIVLFCGELVSQRQRYVAILATNTAFLGVVRFWDELVNVWAILPLEKRVWGKPG